MMMGLGQFNFGISTLAYQTLERNAEWRHPSTSRVGAMPAHQYLGPGDDSTTLSGTIYPGQIGNPGSLDLLREMANTGKAWPMVSGTGRVYGAYVITNLRESESQHTQEGAARKVEFTLALKRVDESATDQLGTQASTL